MLFSYQPNENYVANDFEKCSRYQRTVRSRPVARSYEGFQPKYYFAFSQESSTFGISAACEVDQAIKLIHECPSCCDDKNAQHRCGPSQQNAKRPTEVSDPYHKCALLLLRTIVDVCTVALYTQDMQARHRLDGRKLEGMMLLD